jgi:sensor domain CHASE-containing protein
LSEQVYAENSIQKSTFWDDATRYTASANEDESFVNEIAYMMVTLHRTGA